LSRNVTERKEVPNVYSLGARKKFKRLPFDLKSVWIKKYDAPKPVLTVRAGRRGAGRVPRRSGRAAA